MKKGILIIIIFIMLISVTIIGLKHSKIFKDDVVIIISDNKDIEFGDVAYLSDFVNVENGKLLNKRIEYTNLGKKDIKYTYKNNYGTKFSKKLEVIIKDTTSPVVMLNNSITVSVNYENDVAYAVLCGDNYDSKPKCTIEGNYDKNKIGSYSVTYVATDSNKNVFRKDITINVVSKNRNNSNSNNTKTLFSDIVSFHKNNKTKIGIDVSKWQGDIDFNKVKNAGAEFVMIRVGAQSGFDGDYYLDKKFLNNIKGASEVGLEIGLYFYSYATNKNEAIKQANWVIFNIKDYNITLPIVFDWECWGSFNSLGISLFDVTSTQEAFLKTVTEAGYKGARYGSKSYLTNVWLDSIYPTWLAHYTTKTNYENEYFMWQLCSDGIIDGINGYVDIDVMYVN